MKESAIQKQILDWLAAKQILAFRMNSGQMVRSYGGKTRAVQFGVPGMADVLAFPVMLDLGKAMSFAIPTWIECKAASGKQSPLQKSFQAQVESHGHRYVVARGIEDLEGLL